MIHPVDTERAVILSAAGVSLNPRNYPHQLIIGVMSYAPEITGMDRLSLIRSRIRAIQTFFAVDTEHGSNV